MIFDSTCCFDAHVAKLCRSIDFNLYSVVVEKIRKYLDKPTTGKMIRSISPGLLYAYNMEQHNPTSTDCSAVRMMQPGAHIEGGSLTIYTTGWKYCIGSPWSRAKDQLQNSAPQQHWLAMLRNISYHFYQNMYHHAPYARKINIPLIYQDSGLKRLENELSQSSLSVKQASSVDLFKTRLKLTSPTTHLDSLNV